MKKDLLSILLIIIIISTSLGSCENTCEKQLSTVDSLLNKELQDSAANLLRKISPSSITNEENKAYYALLSTRIDYRQNKPIKSDSTIDYAISYYEKKDNNEKLADCYYYKGSIYFENGDARKAIEYLKKAEYYAKDIDDINIKHKIPEIMMFVNQYLGEDKLAIEYGKKALNLSKGNKNWMAFALGNIAIGYDNLGVKDSCDYYFKQCYPLLKYIPKEERVYFLYDVAYKLAKNDPQKCIEFARNSIAIQPNSTSYTILSDVYMSLGKYKESMQAIDSSYYFASTSIRQDLLEKKLSLIVKQNLAEKDLKEYKGIKSKRDSIISYLRDQNILSLQKEHDLKIAEIQKQKEIVYAILVSFIVMLIVISFIFIKSIS